MEKVKKTGNGILFGCMVFLLFLVTFESILQIPSWLAVAGRMHPMFLHFPIVLLLVSFFTIWIPVNKNADNEWLDFLRLVAALSAVVTAIMGMLLSLEDDRAGQTLQLHKWGGVLVTILGFLFYSYYPLLVKKVRLTRSFTLIAATAIVVTGHWGADLTHGKDFVLGPIKKDRQRLVAPEEAVIFADIIQPIFERKCVSCHGGSSEKGGLLLEDVKGMLAGGKSGPLFIPGQPDTSLIIKRIHLPAGDKKRMPPASKPQLTETEIALLQEWIKAGAVTEAKLFSLPEQDSFRVMATSYLQTGSNEAATPVYTFEAADEKKIITLNNNYRVIAPIGKNSPALAVNFYGRNVYKGKLLEEILPLKKQIVDLNLSRLPVKDEDVKYIQQLENLRKLNLNYTDITSKGVEQLGKLEFLEELTLSGTGITATALEKVLSLPSIASIYVWDTKIDSNQLQSFRTKFPKVYIESGFVDKNNEMIALSPPVIKNPPGVFDNKIDLELKHPFKGVEIRYSLDGSDPDSVNGPVYTTPVPVDKNTTVVARAFKPGWYGSSTVRASFIRRGIEPDSVVMATSPHERFTPPSVKALTDGELGSFDNVGNGDWFGYRQNEAVYYLLFEKEVKVQSVLLIAAKNLGRQIFPPASVEIWGGEDKDHLKPLGKITPQPANKGEFSQLLELKVDFPATTVKCIKAVAQPLKALPEWQDPKRSPAWVFLSEVIVN
ncbi:MAG: chitobiase/beta-hexosaminidase C-terminal domain-containing protein [Chitinophagaceae bacterium]|nr:chitobiase/beta-hexosaminidase C-terminal domain-containing protein [Chitinophagaceae bacterium]